MIPDIKIYPEMAIGIEEAKRIMPILDKFFHKHYGQTWTKYMKNHESYWIEQLSQMPMINIHYAMKWLKSIENTQWLEFPPNPSRFKLIPLLYVKSKLPSALEAYYYTLKKDFQYEIIKEVADKIGIYTLKNMSTEIAIKQFEIIYFRTINEKFNQFPADKILFRSAKNKKECEKFVPLLKTERIKNTKSSREIATQYLYKIKNIVSIKKKGDC